MLTDRRFGSHAEFLFATYTLTMLEFDQDHPLNRVIGETLQANNALHDYYALGSGRSLKNLFSKYRNLSGNEQGITPPTRRFNTIACWSMNNSWIERVDQQTVLDRQAEERAKAEALKAEAEKWAKRRLEIRERDYTQADQLRDLADSVLAEGPKFIKTTRKLIKGTNGKPDREIVTVGLDAKLMTTAVMAASKLQRLAAEMETDHTLEETTTPADIEKVREKRWAAIQETLGELAGIPHVEGDQDDSDEQEDQEDPDTETDGD